MDLRTYEAQAGLRDGVMVRIRAIRPEDKQALRRGFARLSKQAVYHRFFQAKGGLTDDELRYLTELDFFDHVALVVEARVDGADRPVGVGRFVRRAGEAGRERAEIAFTVTDEFQGRGVATLLLEHLARLAPMVGIRRFEAEVLPDNRQMLEVFEHSGLELTERAQEGVVHVELGLRDQG
jgi:GNAT superfamily N-acetyltransferase